jgi:hypothetical protein
MQNNDLLRFSELQLCPVSPKGPYPHSMAHANDRLITPFPENHSASKEAERG